MQCVAAVEANSAEVIMHGPGSHLGSSADMEETRAFLAPLDDAADLAESGLAALDKRHAEAAIRVRMAEWQRSTPSRTSSAPEGSSERCHKQTSSSRLRMWQTSS